MREREMCELGAEWSERLGLCDWCISYVIFDSESEIGELGHSDYGFESKTCVISLYRVPKNDCFNVIEEETLIHELLHCKYPISYDRDSYESVICASMQHQVLNDMARALYMAKYGLTLKEYKDRIIKRGAN